ncbi:redoxin domain-containing protein [Corynebacterium poyangense]|uniref:Redoxin domain-containing protein n=1 Tax=Corynebacterium poyangense TaxID=2684405 RepID=A0A7H0SLM3_9CORY|nr:TlpA disulfide reductase family protein [Corynebacterium poyangense]QNQ89448.1 redoxin domain-containing protein [Corynebacterium poyangense]
MRPEIRWSILGVIVISVVVLLTVPMMLRSSDDSTPTPTANPDDSSTSPTTHSEIAAPPGSRPDCPDIDLAGTSLECLGGHRQPVAQKHMVVVNLWAWWCAPCREEIPLLSSYADHHPEYTVVGVHVDSAGDAGADMLNDLGTSLASFQDGAQQLALKLGLPKVVPITLVFRDGHQVGMFPQVFHSEEELDKAIDSVLS